MTPDEAKRHQETRTAAQRDISDIEALSKSEAFNRYFVGQLNAMYHAEIKVSLMAKTVDERETARHRAVLLRELSEMPGKHRQSAEQYLQRPAPQDQRPMQVG